MPLLNWNDWKRFQAVMPSMLTTCAAHQVRPEAHAVVCICSRHSLISHRVLEESFTDKKKLKNQSTCFDFSLYSLIPMFLECRCQCPWGCTQRRSQVSLAGGLTEFRGGGINLNTYKPRGGAQIFPGGTGIFYSLHLHPSSSGQHTTIS